VTSSEQLSQLRRDVAQFRKSTSLPYWRLGFVEFLLDRIADCIAVGRVPEADGLVLRVRSWLDKNQPRVQAASAVAGSTDEDAWDVPLIEANVIRLRADLQRKRQLVPAPERESFQQGLLKVEALLANRKVRKARAELDLVRANLIRRLQRSYRARAQSAPLVRYPDGAIRSSVRATRSALHPVGPYNNQRALEDVFSLVGERDPIWVEDFMELYSSLHGYVERLGTQDKGSAAKKR